MQQGPAIRRATVFHTISITEKGQKGCGRMEGVWHVGGVWQDGRGTVTQSLLEQYFKCTGFSIAGGQVSWTGNGDGTKCISHYIAHWCPH